MEKYSDLSDKLTELQVKQDSEIRKLFNEILEEYENLERKYNEVEKQCIDYETSTELGLGYEVLQYGKVYNAIYNSEHLEDCLHNIHKLYSSELFEIDCQLLQDIEEQLLNRIEKDKYDFMETRGTMLNLIKEDIVDSVLEKASY